MDMSETDLKKALRTLGYTPRWLRAGLLDAASLAEQLAVFQTGEDRNTEHYRYGAFRRALETRSCMDDETLDAYLDCGGAIGFTVA